MPLSPYTFLKFWSHTGKFNYLTKFGLIVYLLNFAKLQKNQRLR